MSDSTPDSGACPSCGQRGEVGAPCPERVCQRRDYRFIPAEHAARTARTGPHRASPLVGQVLAGYLVVDVIGDGGFGMVYLALKLPIRRRPLRVALKLMRHELAADELTGGQVMHKFEGEADALAALSHPNVVRLLGYGAHDGTPYIVMEYVDSARTLREETAQRARDATMFAHRDIAHILGQALNGLEAAHRQDIVHRDIKPENIMLQAVAGDPMLVRLLDFGLAKFVGERTRTSVTAGTPMYMAPEQLEQGSIGPYTDLYALGVVAFELLTGERAFAGSYQEVCARKLDRRHDPLAAVADLQLPEPTVAFLRRSLAADAASRYRDSAEMRQGLDLGIAALAEWRPGRPIDLGRLATAPEPEPAGPAVSGFGALDRTTPAAESLNTPARHLDDAAWLEAPPPLAGAATPPPLPPGRDPVPPPPPALPDSPPDRTLWRLVGLGAVGLAVFLLIATWIALGAAPRVTRFLLVGGPDVIPGLTTAFRVGVSGDETATPTVRAVRVDGTAAQGEPHGTDWRVVPFLVPRSARDVIRLTMEAATDDARATLDVEVPVTRPRTVVPPPLDPARAGLVTGDSRIAVLPESGMLVAGMDNRVFVRVRDLGGVPLDGATVRVSHPSLDGGEVQRVTDASGLIDFNLRAQQISYTLRIEVRKADERFEGRVALGTVGRQMTLSLETASTPPGVRPRARLTTWQASARVFCEVLLGDVVLWADTARTTLNAAEISPDPLPIGRYDLQCYDHPLAPGEAFASVPIVVAEGDPMAAVLAHVHATGLSERVTAFGPGRVAPGRAADFWLSILRRPLVKPQVLVDTGPETERALAERRRTSRAYVVAALGVVLMLFAVWLVDGLLRSRIESRERLRELALDDTGRQAWLGDANLVRARRILAVLLIGGALLVNGLALFWLVQSLG
ncbi:MAG: serine/threonine protein kinase [Deltaproteobacteria bacterium]|nr:serine/threonine protein kinase [Deltaproteobacteria bacterium]MCB9786141.1 serine/threonine protein kinase [Deltaproteobacteria bacterium]